MSCDAVDIKGLPPKRRTFKLKTFASSEISGTSAKKVKVRFDENVPAVDEYGRPGHLAAVHLDAVVQVDTVAANMTEDYAGRQLWGVFRNIFLYGEGQDEPYLKNLDGRDLRRDMLYRDMLLRGADPSPIPDANATDLQHDVEVTYYLCEGQGIEGRKWDGLIPLAELNTEKNSKVGLEFQTATALPGAPAGVTYDGFVSLTTFATIVYGDLPVRDAEWQVERDDTAEKTVRVERRHDDEVFHYLVIDAYPEDTGAETMTNYSNISASAGAIPLFSGYSAAEIARCHMIEAQAHPLFDVGGRDLDLDSSPSVIPIFLTKPYDSRGDMGAGPVKVTFDRATATSTRWLVRRYKPHKEENRNKLAKRFGLPTGSAMSRIIKARNTGRPRFMHGDLLPQAIGRAAAAVGG